jgi:hypothetical protein
LLKEKGKNMHIDENKTFDKRNVQRNIKNERIAQKDYEIYLSRLPDVSDKVFNPEESIPDSRDFESKKDNEIQSKMKREKKGEKKGEKKKTKGKGK